MFMMYQNVDAKYLIMGETINPKGNWSSYPPHKHDTDNLPYESKLEEIYFFKVNPEKGFGFQRIYSENFDKVFVIKNNTIITIPFGYHPVVAIPSCEIYYMWVLAGKKRILKSTEDPNLK